MDVHEFEGALRRALDDDALSRDEGRALRDLLIAPLDPRTASVLRSRVFAVASEREPAAAECLRWVQRVMAFLDTSGQAGGLPAAEALFSPGEACVRRITGLAGEARETLDVCVFTITDDRISEALVFAHRRGVRVRIVTDDDKCEDPGSDIQRLRGAGILVATDRSEFHMHHKFAIVDRRLLLTGSYNWTRSAASVNEENLVVSGDPRLLGPFQAEFERLWRAFSPGGRG